MTTTRIPPDFKEFLKCLKDHEARFLLVGGYAVNAFGYVRNTVDIDVWVAPDVKNLIRVIKAVRTFGFASATDDVLDAPKAMIRMGLPPVRIEVMKTFSGVEFDDCWPRRVDLAIDNLTISMISLQDLETNKLASGRPKNHDFDNAFF